MQDLNEVRITGTIFNEPKYVKTQTNEGQFLRWHRDMTGQVM